MRILPMTTLNNFEETIPAATLDTNFTKNLVESLFRTNPWQGWCLVCNDLQRHRKHLVLQPLMAILDGPTSMIRVV